MKAASFKRKASLHLPVTACYSIQCHTYVYIYIYIILYVYDDMTLMFEHVVQLRPVVEGVNLFKITTLYIICISHEVSHMIHLKSMRVRSHLKPSSKL